MNIKKATLNFAPKFWWMVISYRLCPTAAKNLMTWDGAALITSLVAGYDIDFATIIRYQLHEQAFAEPTILPFPCLVQQLCDEAGVLEI